MANSKRDRMFSLMLSAREYEFLTKEAAKNTLRTGKRTSAGEVLRLMAFGKTGEPLKFTAPAVEVQDAQGMPA